jgi:hypothetical protein
VILYHRALKADEVAGSFKAVSADKSAPPAILREPASTRATPAHNGLGINPATAPIKPAGISIALYAGVTVEGEVGQTYGIQYTANLSDTNNWRGAANITLVEPTELWFDVQAGNKPARYYRVVPGPISIP